MNIERLRELLATVNQNESPNPMGDEDIDALCVRKTRDSNETIPVPPSLRAVLSVDRDFRVWGTPMLAEALDGPDGQLKTTSGTEIVNGWWPGSKWNDAKQPALLPLFSPGDQKVFLYLGEPDADGFYPVGRFADQPELWIESPNLFVELFFEKTYDDDFNDVWTPRADVELDWHPEKLLEQAKKANAKALKRERLG